MNKYVFLQDKRFLQQLDALRIKLQFVKITVLNWKEEPLELIQGIAISGSVNLDGSSSMRRTATLSLFAEEKENNLENIDSLFAVDKKCFLLLGIVNTTPNFNYITKDEYSNVTNNIINYQLLYGDIVWFPLGLYVMFNPSISHSMQGVTISMQLKDKMCLLNGDLGGEIHSAVDFSTQDLLVDDNSGISIEKNPVLVYNIIKLLVNHWGNEKLENIIISEVPLRIKRPVKWTGNAPVWLVQTSERGYILTTIEDSSGRKFENGADIGFVYSDFIYPEELKGLTCNAGDTVTSVLDKLIGIMGNYEYFYDALGNFIFREKQNYLNMTNVAYWAKEGNKGQNVGNLPSDVYLADYYRLTKSVYSFVDNLYTTTYNNSLNYNNIKNDFVVWGANKGVNGVTLPCRFHLAIDKKPSLNEHSIILYLDDYQVWRARAAAAGLENIITRQSLDWRLEIYYQMLEDLKNGTGLNIELNNTYFQYYAELKDEFPKIFDLRPFQVNKEEDLETLRYCIEELSKLPLRELNMSSEQKLQYKNFKKLKEAMEYNLENFYSQIDLNQSIGYKVDIENHPEEMEYFLDFIDENSLLGCYSVSNIGRRAKIIDDNNEGINCVFEPDIPDIVYIDVTKYGALTQLVETQLTAMGQRWTQINPLLSPLLETGGIFNSCFEKIKDLLYQYTHVNNTISITTLPIYYLEPNTRITVEDKPAGIYGDYIIQSISLPLDINSTMNINAYKALQKI